MIKKQLFIILLCLFCANLYGKGGFKIGPSVKFGAIHPWNIAATSFFGDLVSADLSFGTTSATFSDVNASITNYDGRIRLHPWKGSLFVGLIVGHQKVQGDQNANVTVTVASVPVSVNIKADVTINGMYVTPHVGWLWRWNSGILLGFELGVQIPFSTSSAIASSVSDASQQALLDLAKATAAYQVLEADVNSLATDAGNTTLPYVALLRFGYLF